MTQREWIKKELEERYNSIDYLPYIPGNREIGREDLFSLETIILLNDILDVQKQMLDNFNKLLLKQEVLDKKLTDLQDKTTQINTNLQNLKADIQGIKNTNSQLSNDIKNLQANTQNLVQNSRQTKQDVAEIENTLKCVTKGSYKKCIRVENQD